MTVETYSAVLPMLKWAHEFTYSEDAGRFPVKFVDLCSGINRQDTPFNSEDYDNSFTMNSYIGRECFLM